MIATRYINPAIKQLADQQVRYAPIDVRLQQVDRAEHLLAEIEPDQEYRYPDLCEHIVTYRGEMYPDLVLNGEEARHDLRCFIEDLSDSVNLRVENSQEPVLTVEDVSKKFSVSTKTVDRWRNKGLVSRRFVFGNRKRIGFLRSSVDRFVKTHADEVERGRRFSQLTDEERERIIQSARRLAQYGESPADVSRTLAQQFHRSPETIRYTLKNFDHEHPEIAVFPNASSPLKDTQKKELFRAFRRGVTVKRLAQQYGRTRASIYRIVTELRAQRIFEQPIDYMDNKVFQHPKADELILGPAPEGDRKGAKTKAPPGLPPYLASLYAIPLLSREEEAYHFRKMNYLKFKAAELRKNLNPLRPKSAVLDEIESLLNQSLQVKNFLIRSNLRLVVSIAKKHINANSNFFEMVSDGNMSLIRAIEKFDYGKGFKFSTYASWAIMKNFARSIPAEHTLLDRYRTGNEEVFQQSRDNRANQFQEEMVNKKQHQLIMSILDQLDTREKEIIMYRYGLNQNGEPHTLEQVGVRLGVTKERIRQLESRALKKLRKIALDDHLDIPGL